MIDRFFLHRVQVHGDRLGINQGLKFAAVIEPRLAASARAFRQKTFERAQAALDPAAHRRGEHGIPDPGIRLRNESGESAGRRVAGKQEHGA